MMKLKMDIFAETIKKNIVMKPLYLLVFFFFSFSTSAQNQLGGDIDGEFSGDESGWAVSSSSDGNIIAIGARRNSGNGSESGSVRVYQYSNGIWIQLGSDIDGEASDDQSGWAVSLSSDGTILAIGAIKNDGNGNNSGHVRVYEFVNSNWIQLGGDINGAASGDWFGYSLSLSDNGTILAIGAYLSDVNGNRSGQVKVYEYSNNTWAQLGSDINGEAANHYSGASVSLSDDGSILAIGASKVNMGGGRVKVYKYNNVIGSWVQRGYDLDGLGGDNFGRSVSLSSDGTILAVGGDEHDGNGTNSGYVKVYEFVIGAGWTQLGSDIDGDGSYHYFGYSVSLSDDGSSVAIGAKGYPGGGNVRVYEYSNATWIQLGNDIGGEGSGDESGWAVSLSSDGTVLAIGAPFNDGSGNDAGHVRVFDLGSTSTFIEQSFENSSLTYPNPNSGLFSIQVDQEHIGSSYQILDNLGRLIDKGIIRELSQDFDLSDKPKGVYRIQVSNEKSLKTVNVVIE